MAFAAAAVVGLGIAALPDFLTGKELASGALMALMTNYPLTEAGLYIVRPPGHTLRERCGSLPNC
jgi:DNA-binding transcriptional LysR family regulator